MYDQDETSLFAISKDKINYYSQMPKEALFKRDESGWLPIHYAASGGEVDLVSYMLSQAPELLNAKLVRGGKPWCKLVKLSSKNGLEETSKSKEEAGVSNALTQSKR